MTRHMTNLLLLILSGMVLWLCLKVNDAEAVVKRACAKPSAAKWLALPREYPHFYRSLHRYFGRSWREAAIVSWGEGGWNPYATNGQYRGTFQMGSWARSRYGHSHTLPGQVFHASRYWRESGWSGWECRPW